LSNGPLVTQNTVSRRRIDLTQVLSQVVPGTQPLSNGIVVAPMIMLLLDE